MTINRSEFGSLADGTRVDTIEITNANGIRARFITFGGILTSLLVPDREGKPADIVLGFNDLASYEAGHPYFGALIGRFANRIGRGTFTLDGAEIKVSCNDSTGQPEGVAPRNHLHGGHIGYDKRVWDAETWTTDSSAGVTFTLESEDGEEGYPGAMSVAVRCSLNEINELTLEYTARTDKNTPVNLTNHSYFNLAGEGSGTVHDQVLSLACPSYLAVDAEAIPTGEISPVADGPMDFQQAKPIGRDIAGVPGGYDHCFVSADQSETMKGIAVVSDPVSGRRMVVETTQPAVQFYSGNFLDGSLTGKSGRAYEKQGAFCLETQCYPDAVNHDSFPSCILRPGETYHHTTIYRFGAQ